MMKDHEYKAIQAQMLALGTVIEKLDCLGYLERNSLADTTGPLLDPTMYRDAAPNMKALRGLAMSFLQVRAAMEKVRATVLKTAAEGKMIPPPETLS